ncbi:polysaccharide biosynthesis C-terminal domain-containing protein [uncultured Methanobacterium sp.]|uniref:oligosaccharide flippase family protein n=1 Tax=uncultured Methanobacterium sp. TaxID=176306 RepID=UPI002AA6900E|nr:polysaccharide biosynthesis C-terminal domain-containing protein [uncultured Methanobacterium sp.]
MNEYKLFVHRIGLMGLTNILLALSSLIFLPVMTKSFSTADYGIWVQINTTIALVVSASNLGLPYTMLRFLSAEKDKTVIQERFYSITAVLIFSASIISLILLIFSSTISSYLFNNNSNIALLLIPLTFFSCLNGLLINYFRTFQQMKKYSIFLILQTYLAVFIVSYLALNGFDIYIASTGLLISNLIIFIIISILIIKDIGLKIPKFSNIREYLSFGIPTVPANLSYWILDSSDRYLIGILMGTLFVGYYSPGYTLGYIIVMIMAPFSLLLPSILPKYYEEKNEKQMHIYLDYSLKFFLLFAIPSVFGLSMLSKPLLLILTTPEIALNGYLVTPFIALSFLLYGFHAIISNVLVLEKKTKIFGLIWITAALLNLGLNIFLIPYIGILGAAISTLIAYFIATLITLVYTTKSFKFNFNPKFILKSTLASIIMSLIIVIINPQGIIMIIFTTLICSAVYFLLLRISGGIKEEEIKLLKSIMLNSN